MPCLVVLLAMLMPRLVMFFIWLLTGWFGQAFHFWLWPLLGFFFMPYTTLAYMGGMLSSSHSISGIWLVLLIVAIMVDLGHYGATRRASQQHQ